MPTDPWSALLRPAETGRLWTGGKDWSTASMTELGKIAERGFGAGTRAVGRAEEAWEPALGFLKALLYGDQEAVSQAIGPARSRIISQYDAARKQIAEFAPRGGGRSELLAELPFRQAGEIGRLTQEARTEAAKELTDLGSLYAQLSGQQLGLAESATGRALMAALAKREQERTRKTEMGKSLGTLLAIMVGGTRG